MPGNPFPGVAPLGMVISGRKVDTIVRIVRFFGGHSGTRARQGRGPRRSGRPAVTLQLYGVVRARHPRVPRTVCWEDLAMVVGEPEPDPAAHLAVVSALLEGGPVLPVRFGTVAEDEDVVRTGVLAPAAGTYRADLDRLDGLAEVHVCLRFTEPGSAGRAARSDVLLAQVAERARDSVSLPAGESADERWAFLVGLGDLLVVRDAVAGLGGGGGVQADWLGPLPAYSFLDRRTCSRRSR
jgi:hypothetical protein